MAKINRKEIYFDVVFSLVITIVVLLLLKYISGKSILPESWIIVYLLILILLRIVKK